MDIKKVVKSLNVYTVKKGIAYLRQYGWKEFRVRLSERFEGIETDYGEWCKKGYPVRRGASASARYGMGASASYQCCCAGIFYAGNFSSSDDRVSDRTDIPALGALYCGRKP